VSHNGRASPRRFPGSSSENLQRHSERLSGHPSVSRDYDMIQFPAQKGGSTKLTLDMTPGTSNRE